MSAGGRWLEPARFGPLLLAATAALSAWWSVHHLPTPDEGGILTNAVKILDGGVFYRDIDAYAFPASNYAVAAAMALFGEHLGVARTLAALLYCATVLSLWAAALPLLGSARAALFGASLLAFKLLGFPIFTAYTHAEFSLAFALLALPLLLSDGARSWRLFLAGACIGASFAAKQSLGLYLAAGVVAQLALPRLLLRRTGPAAPGEIAAFACGFALVVLPMFGYFAAHGALGTMLHSGFVSPFTGYAPMSSIPPGPMLAWWELGTLHASKLAVAYLPLLPLRLLNQRALPIEALYPVWGTLLEALARAAYTSVPLVLGAALWRWLRSWREPADPGAWRLFALAQLAAAFVVSAFPRVDWPHLVSVYPVVWLLLFALVRPGRRAARVEVAGVALLLAVTAALTVATHRRMTFELELPRARVWIEPSESWLEPVIRQIAERVPEGGPFFVHGQEAHVYFLADRYSAWPFVQLYPGQTGAGDGAELVRMLKRARPQLIYRGMGAWPGSAPLRDYAPALYDYVVARYEPVPRFFELHPPPAGELPDSRVFDLLQRSPRSARRPARGAIR